MTTPSVRDAEAGDWPQIWPIVESVVRAGETYAWPRDLTEAAARTLWMVESPGSVLVATDGRAVLGSVKITPNHMGPGAHVANASFVVSPTARGLGVGRLLGEAALERARTSGFRAMQFNAVIETNAVAVRLWTSLGFEVIGTVPEAFDHPQHGPVGLHIMHRRL